MSFTTNYAQSLPGAFEYATPARVREPKLLFFNRALASELGMTEFLNANEIQLSEWFSGHTAIEGTKPIAQAYAGHQFANFVPSLGDGRAALLGEWNSPDGRIHDVAFKGSGPTSFSRGGDGKAAIGPMLREALIGEALHGLGIPCTRALAVVATGETIQRELPLPGAVLTRVAASHLRIGTIQYFAAQGDREPLKRVVDFAIDRHDPELTNQDDKYLAWLEAVSQRQATLIAQWLSVGFIHGVMNTDNAALSGESIDFGPCAFMDAFDPATVFSSIDRRGRYAYGNQPMIANWNLARLAECVLPLLDPAQPERALEAAQGVITRFAEHFRAAWLDRFRRKLGLLEAVDEDLAFLESWLNVLKDARADFTMSHRSLIDALLGNEAALRIRVSDAPALAPWLERWCARLAREARPLDAVATTMRAANPCFIPRNHQVELALSAASERGDLTAFQRLMTVLVHPFEEHLGFEDLMEPASSEANACYRTYCGT